MMNGYLKVALLSAAVLASLAVRLSAIRDVTAASPTPTATPQPTATPSPTEADAVLLLQQGIAALNRGDIPTVLSLYSDNITFQGGGPLCFSAPCIGKAAVEPELKILVTGHMQFTLTDVGGSRGSATARFTAQGDYTKTAGVQRIASTMTLEASGGKVVAFYAPLDTSDAETASYIAFYNAVLRPPAQAAKGAGGGLPPTGTGGGRTKHNVISWIGFVGLALGSALIAAGCTRGRLGGGQTRL